jgi:hypothetical protein
MEEHVAAVKEWLSDLGFAIEDVGDAFRATHEDFPGLLFRAVGPGTLFAYYFKTEGESGEILSFVNSLNDDAVSTRYAIDVDGDFSIESWLPATTDHHTFEVFMSGWFDAWDRLMTNPKAERFLR